MHRCARARLAHWWFVGFISGTLTANLSLVLAAMNNGSTTGQPIDGEQATGLEQTDPVAMNIDTSGAALTAGTSTAALNAAGSADLQQ